MWRGSALQASQFIAIKHNITVRLNFVASEHFGPADRLLIAGRDERLANSGYGCPGWRFYFWLDGRGRSRSIGTYLFLGLDGFLRGVTGVLLWRTWPVHVVQADPLPSGRPEQFHRYRDQANRQMAFPNDRRHTLWIILKTRRRRKRFRNRDWCRSACWPLQCRRRRSVGRTQAHSAQIMSGSPAQFSSALNCSSDSP